jgi:molybdate transport system substrate-binding protein
VREENVTGQGDTRVIEAGVIEVLGTLAVRGVLIEVAADFRARTRLTFAAGYKSTNAQLIAISAGATGDVAIMTRQGIDQLVGEGKIVAGSTADIAQSGVGIAVRAGAPKPDIGTVEALTRTLKQARSIGYSDGPSGAYIARLLQRLGIAAETAPKTKLTSRPVAELVAEGEAEVGMQQIVAILPVRGADLVGPLPGELQNVIIYAAGLSSGGEKRAAAQNFIAFLRSNEIGRLIRAKGMEPG